MCVQPRKQNWVQAQHPAPTSSSLQFGSTCGCCLDSAQVKLMCPKWHLPAVKCPCCSYCSHCPRVTYQPQPKTQHPWDMEANGKLWEAAPRCWWVQKSREGAGTDGHNTNWDGVGWDGTGRYEVHTPQCPRLGAGQPLPARRSQHSASSQGKEGGKSVALAPQGSCSQAPCSHAAAPAEPLVQ